MAVERGTDLGARAIQIFNQNPRPWKPREYSEEEIATSTRRSGKRTSTRS